MTIQELQNIYYVFENCLKTEGKQFILATQALNSVINELQAVQQNQKDDKDIEQAMSA